MRAAAPQGSRSSRRRRHRAAAAVLAAFAAVPAGAARFPNVVLITIDTLRWDRLSCHGYGRPTTPNLDALLAAGASFDAARTPEPLTSPSMASMLTSLYPHEHGSTRNGLGVRPGLPSLPGILGKRGYHTAAFVGNWTLKDDLTGLGEYFDVYSEVFSRKRWFGLFNAEATADDLNAEALAWVREERSAPQPWPFFLWVHYVEPHAPYRFHADVARPLGLDPVTDEARAENRYDTEVAFTDRAVGRLLGQLGELVPPEDTLVVFLADHGESLGEHRYWGHGRHLYEETLKIPMGIRWTGRLAPRTVTAPASLLDVAPTVLGLVGLRVPETFRGYDWSGTLEGGEAPAPGRVTFHEAHKGAVRGKGPDRRARRNGLLAVAVVDGGAKEVLRVKGGNRALYDMAADPREKTSTVRPGSRPSERLAEWLAKVREGLAAADDLPPPSLDEEALEKLRALGYID